MTCLLINPPLTRGQHSPAKGRGYSLAQSLCTLASLFVTYWNRFNPVSPPRIRRRLKAAHAQHS